MLEDAGKRLVSAMGNPGQQPAWMNFVPFVMVLAILYFLILLPMKRQRKKVQEFQTSLKVGDKVVTTSGIYGEITRLKERTVQVQVANNVRVEMSRAAIAGYQGQEPVVPESGSA